MRSSSAISGGILNSGIGGGLRRELVPRNSSVNWPPGRIPPSATESPRVCLRTVASAAVTGLALLMRNQLDHAPVGVPQFVVAVLAHGFEDVGGYLRKRDNTHLGFGERACRAKEGEGAWDESTSCSPSRWVNTQGKETFGRSPTTRLRSSACS